MFVFLLITSFRLIEETIRNDLETAARLVAANAARDLASGNLRALQESLAALQWADHVVAAEVRDASGSVVAAFRRVESDAIREPATGETTGTGAWHGQLEVRTPIVADGRRLGILSIQASKATSNAALLRNAVLGGLAVIVGILSVLAVMERLLPSVTLPLTRLADVMERISNKQDYSVRAPVNPDCETSRLANAFNEILTQIEQRDTWLEGELKERRRVEERLAQLAHFDSLTDLPNRNYFNEKLTRAIGQATRNDKSVALIFIDLDNFKLVNDTLGHHLGDAVLKCVADRLTETLRASDTVCRLSGDEFAVLVEAVRSDADAMAVAEKIRTTLSQPFVAGGHEVFIGASIGVALSDPRKRDVQKLFRDADTAMYHAKAQGRNNCQLFHQDMNARAVHRRTIESGLRRAVEREDFILHYQPQIDLRTKRIVAVEALLRWRHPELGFVSPAEFIPIAEESRLINQIGEWALEAACNDAQRWKHLGMSPLTVAVNLSGRQFNQPDIVAKIGEIIARTQMDARMIELELTESTLIENAQSNIRRLRELRELGVALAIDDFGSGYSSLNYLRRFPIQRLKIDRGFVQHIPYNRDDVAIITAIVKLARSLDLEVVAEGVERTDQLRMLSGLGCDRVQGFLISRPVPAEMLPELWARFLAGQSAAHRSVVGFG
jgi:diguanylate cyclase (GGDEF)-like protein